MTISFVNISKIYYLLSYSLPWPLECSKESGTSKVQLDLKGLSVKVHHLTLYTLPPQCTRNHDKLVDQIYTNTNHNQVILDTTGCA